MENRIRIDAQKVKQYVFDEKKRMLCNVFGWCGLADGYCPTYECGALDRLKRYTDRQWENAVRYCKQHYIYDHVADLAEDVLDVLRFRKPRGKANHGN